MPCRAEAPEGAPTAVAARKARFIRATTGTRKMGRYGEMRRGSAAARAFKPLKIQPNGRLGSAIGEETGASPRYWRSGERGWRGPAGCERGSPGADRRPRG